MLAAVCIATLAEWINIFYSTTVVRSQRLFRYTQYRCRIIGASFILFSISIGLIFLILPMSSTVEEQLRIAYSLQAAFFGIQMVVTLRSVYNVQEALRIGFPFFYKVKGFQLRFY